MATLSMTSSGSSQSEVESTTNVLLGGNSAMFISDSRTTTVNEASSSPTSDLMEYSTNTIALLSTDDSNTSSTLIINENSTEESSDYYYYYDADMAAADDRRIYARFYMLSVILPIGIFFNTFAFIAFLWSPNIRRTTTGRYLIALTIADSMFIIGDFLRWLNTYDREGQILGIEFAEVNLFGCATIYFLRYYGQLASGWLTVAITIERFIVVAFPLKAGRISTVNSTHTTILLIYIVSGAMSLFPYWTLHIADSGYIKWCEYKSQEDFDKYNWAVIRFASILLPSFIIFLFTGLIILELEKLSKKRQGMANVNQGNSRKILERQLTLMLVAVAVTFLILRLPYTITYYLFDFREDIWGEDIDEWLEYRLWLAKDVCDAIATANYAINFFLYCLTGSQFRANMMACIRCERVQTIRTRLYTSTVKHNKSVNVNQDLSDSTITLCTSRTMETNGSLSKELKPCTVEHAPI